MDDFTFESANRLWWSNKYLDFVMGTQLLLLIYQEREEASPFRKRKQELETKCIESIQDLPGLAAKLRLVLPSLAKFGSSREDNPPGKAAFRTA